MKGKAAVFVGVDKPIEIREYPVVNPGQDQILVRISMCTVCGSDVHTWTGRRPGKTPAILGHEIMGRIVELGDGISHDCLGAPLKVGDRVTWSLYSNCGKCYYCKSAGLPQKCVELEKYGHEACDSSPHFNGGFAEYIYLDSGTTILKVPDEISDEEATPVNCAASTAAGGFEAVPVEPGDIVLIQGLGLVGLYAAAMARDRGARMVITADIDEERLKIAPNFGADEVLQVKGLSNKEIGDKIRDLSEGRGADLVVEATGFPPVVPAGIEALRIGGKYVLLGMVFPGSEIQLYGDTLISKYITLKGVHNYYPRNLVQSMDFLRRNHDKFPFKELITLRYDLEDTEKALQASVDKLAIRPALVMEDK